jgi:hypothetical protein
MGVVLGKPIVWQSSEQPGASRSHGPLFGKLRSSASGGREVWVVPTDAFSCRFNRSSQHTLQTSPPVNDSSRFGVQVLRKRPSPVVRDATADNRANL